MIHKTLTPVVTAPFPLAVAFPFLRLSSFPLRQPSYTHDGVLAAELLPLNPATDRGLPRRQRNIARQQQRDFSTQGSRLRFLADFATDKRLVRSEYRAEAREEAMAREEGDGCW